MANGGVYSKGPDWASHVVVEGKLITGQVMTATPRKGRTQPRNGAYWAGLHTAVDATDAWPTTGRLHNDLKELCGYVENYTNPLTGERKLIVQSTAFDKMNESEFAAYFRLAQMKFIARMGFDPWQRVEA